MVTPCEAVVWPRHWTRVDTPSCWPYQSSVLSDVPDMAGYRERLAAALSELALHGPGVWRRSGTMSAESCQMPLHQHGKF